MSKITTEQRLNLYKKALVDYEVAFNTQIGYKNTELGFCNYFDEVHDMDFWYWSFRRTLPELYNQRITNENSDYHYPINGSSREGLEMRITALKAAIKETENKINHEKGDFI